MVRASDLRTDSLHVAGQHGKEIRQEEVHRAECKDERLIRLARRRRSNFPNSEEFRMGGRTPTFAPTFSCSFQNAWGESNRIVTGPSFTSSTCIMAWKRPVSQVTPQLRSLATKYSYSSRASSGGAASSNDGRLPLRTSP